MAGFEAAGKGCEDEHDCAESDGRPVVRKQGPHGGSGGKRARVRLRNENGAIGRIAEEFFPARGDAQCVRIEHGGAQSEEHASGEKKICSSGAGGDEVTEVDDSKMESTEKSREQSATPEDR